MKQVAVDSDIFFFSVGQDKRDRNVRLASSLLEHIDNHPDLELYVDVKKESAALRNEWTRE
jgi:hypothetical protein